MQVGGCADVIWRMDGMATGARDFYDVLGVSRDADADTIKRVFRARARECHPDVAAAPGGPERFRELANAYDVLSTRESRLLYDRFGYRGPGNGGFDGREATIQPTAGSLVVEPRFRDDPRLVRYGAAAGLVAALAFLALLLFG